MFNPSRDEARRFLIEAWRKHRAREPSTGLEQIAAALVAQHPEYHAILEDPERSLERDWRPEHGDVNPFLHLSLHLAVAEQLERIDFSAYAREIEARLRAQRRRLEQLRGRRHGADRLDQVHRVPAHAAGARAAIALEGDGQIFLGVDVVHRDRAGTIRIGNEGVSAEDLEGQLEQMITQEHRDWVEKVLAEHNVPPLPDDTDIGRAGLGMRPRS